MSPTLQASDHEIGWDRYSSNPDYGGDHRDSRSVILHDIAAVGDRFGYVYDYGDMWGVAVTVEKIVRTRGAAPLVRCTHGRRAGPPEDIGGPWGYDALVAVMRTRRGADYRQWRDIHGGVFDPTDFDLDLINDDLARWAASVHQRPEQP